MSRPTPSWFRRVLGAERTATLPQYPLTSKLRDAPVQTFKKARAVQTRFLRPQVVSPDLCDDVLARIGPSLEKHKGCDIIDLYPGVGLWSSKLHDFLQPRSHILLEPSTESHHYLEHLVNRPGSTYKLVTADPSEYDTYGKLIDDGFLPHQKRLSREDPRGRQLNTSLLVTGSLMWQPILPGVGFDNMARQLLAAFPTKAWHNEVFHTMGFARMLIWGLRDDTKRMVPRSIHAAGKSGLALRKIANVTEVVTSPHGVNTRKSTGRSPRYEFESLAQAINREKRNGTELPVIRRENIHDFADDIMNKTNGTGIMSTSECLTYLKNQEREGKSVIGIVPGQLHDYWRQEIGYEAKPPPPPPRIEGQMGRPVLSKEHVAMVKMRTYMNKILRLNANIDSLVDVGEEIYHLECKILAMNDGEGKEAELRKMEAMQKEFDTGVAGLNANVRSQVPTELDDRISLRTVPRLLWDQRPFEPLVARPEEMWPKSEVSLVDVEPLPIPEGQTVMDLEYFQDFVAGIGYPSALTLPVALDSMQHGASEIVDQVPALRDPKRGGRLNMNNLRVRMLTVEMLEGLCKAYREWPFRIEEADHPRYFRVRDKLGFTPKFH